MGSFTADGMLQQKDMQHHIQLENISRNGAVVRLKDEAGEQLRPGDCCTLTLETHQGKSPLIITTHVVHYSFTLAGLRFSGLNKESEDELEHVIESFEKKKAGTLFSSTGLNHHLALLPTRDS